MEVILAVTAGALVAGSIYLLLSRHLVSMIFGLVMASNGVNLIIFAAGRLAVRHPPLIPVGFETPVDPVANALPQALILTAIVIGFAMLVFIFVLFYRTCQVLGTAETEATRMAESLDHHGPTVDARPQEERGT